MKKRDFLKLVEENKNIFKCLILNNASITNQSKHTSIEICWYNQNNQRTTIKVMRGSVTDLKCINELNKYTKWLQSSK